METQDNCQNRGRNKQVPNKKTEKTPRKKLNKIKTRNLPDIVFKTMVIRMLNEPRVRIDELSENFNSIKRTWKP